MTCCLDWGKPLSLSVHHVPALWGPAGELQITNIFFFLLDRQIPQVHERTWHCQSCQKKYIKSKRHNVTLGWIRWAVQDTCFPCSGAGEPEVEMMTFRTFCKIQLLTQLFSAGVREGRKIYCLCFVEVDNFFGVCSSPTGWNAAMKSQKVSLLSDDGFHLVHLVICSIFFSLKI